MLTEVVPGGCEEKLHGEVEHEEEELELHDVLHELGDQSRVAEQLDCEDAVQEQKHHEVNVLELDQVVQPDHAHDEHRTHGRLSVAASHA